MRLFYKVSLIALSFINFQLILNTQSNNCPVSEKAEEWVSLHIHMCTHIHTCTQVHIYALGKIF